MIFAKELRTKIFRLGSSEIDPSKKQTAHHTRILSDLPFSFMLKSSPMFLRSENRFLLAVAIILSSRLNMNSLSFEQIRTDFLLQLATASMAFKTKYLTKVAPHGTLTAYHQLKPY